MNKLPKINILKEINDSILVSSNLYGENVEKIDEAFQLDEGETSFIVSFLPVFAMFVVTVFLTSIGISIEKSFLVAVAFAFSLSFYFIFYSLKRQAVLTKEKEKILDKKVDISNETLNVIYNKIEENIDIEPKYVLSIRELDTLRECFFDRMPINVENKKLAFLNPKNKLK